MWLEEEEVTNVCKTKLCIKKAKKKKWMKETGLEKIQRKSHQLYTKGKKKEGLFWGKGSSLGLKNDSAWIKE